MGKNGKCDGDERAKHDEAATASAARTTATKSKTSLSPTEYSIKEKEFEQTSQTSLPIAHGNLLNLNFEHSSLT